MDLDDGRGAELDDQRRPRPPRRTDVLRRPGGRPRREPIGQRSARLDPAITVEPLQVYEHNGDGHTLQRHCDHTPGADARRLAEHPWLLATGSFLSVTVAQGSTEACVAANRDQVMDWLGGEKGRLAIDHEIGEVIGSVLERRRWLAGETTPQPATHVLTVLRRNSTYPSGFAVRTSYPVSRTSGVRPTHVPLEEGTVNQACRPYPVP